MIDARFVPIEKWPCQPTASHNQKNAPFRASYAKTLDLLESELNHLSAKSIVIQAYFDRRDIRNDGWPRSNTRPKDHGVILTFSTGANSQNTMSFPCDRFRGWEDNLRAIALSLQALRMVDRYGVTRNSEQYRGFVGLPPADPGIARKEAIAFLSRVTGLPANQIMGDPNGAYRLAAGALHPDKGGSHDQFVKLQQHWSVMTSGAPQ